MQWQNTMDRLRNGFHPSFWVANVMELFERLAYYGQASVLSIFLRDHLKFNEIQAGQLSSIFGGLIYFLPIFAGTLADKFGFRHAFTIAFAGLAGGYFLIGSTGMATFIPYYQSFPLFGVLAVFLVATAMAGAFIKPSVLGTVAVASTAETKSLGYAIYYLLVNTGSAIGPLLAYLVREQLGIQYVYLVSAISCFLMLTVNLLWYRNAPSPAGQPIETLTDKLSNLVRVLTNYRFMIFLLIFSLYWTMFWQIYIVVPYFITDFLSKDAPYELIISTGAWAIMLLQLVINRLTRSMSAPAAILAGFAVSSLGWVVILIHPSIPLIVAGIVVFSIGEMTQAPRYYEYISELAPPGQVGLFQGYAFLPIAIAWFLGGTLGGWMYTHYAKANADRYTIWMILLGIGCLATLLMALYNRFLGGQPERK